MQESIMAWLTAKDDRIACTMAEKIIAESRITNKWYPWFAALLEPPKSLVRNRVIHILAANVQWDCSERFEAILPAFLKHVTDDKPISARQCIKALTQIGLARPQYTPRILSCFREADLSKHRDSMRPLIQKDLDQAEKTWMDAGLMR